MPWFHWSGPDRTSRHRLRREVRTPDSRELLARTRDHGRAPSQARAALRRAGRPRGAPARAGRRDPLRARADDDVRRVPGDRAQGDREPDRRRAAAPDPRQGHVRLPAPAGEPAAPGLVQPGHAAARAHPVHDAPRGRGRPARRSTSPRRSTWAPTAWPGGSTGCAGPTASRSRWRTAGTRATCCPGSTGRTSAARCTRSSAPPTASPSTAPSRRCGARPPTRRPPAGSTPR